jgi:hypothetical protein
MTDYVLKVSSYGGIVPGATHYRGRVEGPHPESCHGSMTYNAPESRGKWTCEQGHELPRRADWAVEAPWSEGRYERYSAKQFEGDGPEQFKDQQKVIETAVKRFTGELVHNWWEDKHVPGQPGDRLFLGFVARDESEIDVAWGRLMGTVPHGTLLAEIPADSKEEAHDGEPGRVAQG